MDYRFKYSFSENDREYSHFSEFMKDNLLDIISFCELFDENGNKVDVSSFRLKHPGESKISLYDGYKEKVEAL